MLSHNSIRIVVHREKFFHENDTSKLAITIPVNLHISTRVASRTLFKKYDNPQGLHLSV